MYNVQVVNAARSLAVWCGMFFPVLDAKNSPRLVILKALLDSDYAVVRAVVKYLVSVCMCAYACVSVCSNLVH